MKRYLPVYATVVMLIVATLALVAGPWWAKEGPAPLNGDAGCCPGPSGVVTPGAPSLLTSPIEKALVSKLHPFPPAPFPQYVLQAVVGLSSGCSEPGDYTLARSGDTFTVRITNTFSLGGSCTATYRTAHLLVRELDAAPLGVFM